MIVSTRVAIDGVVNWESVTGLSSFTLELITFPIFSAIAGVLTNWTGVLMLFRPVHFHGFKMPGLETAYPWFPRWVQVLPTFAPGGMLGFQGMVAARAEKMASITVDNTLAKVGRLSDIMESMEPERLAAHALAIARRELRSSVDELMQQEHPQLWHDTPDALKKVVYERVDAQLPEIINRALDTVKGSIDTLVDPKLLAIGYLRKHPESLKRIIESAGAPELRFMVRVGLLGAPFGLLLALLVHYQDRIAFIRSVPTFVFILLGAACIGALVNILAIKIVFTPGEPKPRYKCLWKQAKMAKRQPEAAADLGHALAYEVLTVENIADDLLNGPRGDKTRMLINHQMRAEISRMLGAARVPVRAVVGGKEFEALQVSAAETAAGFAPMLYEDVEFSAAQSEKVSKFAGQKLAELPPDEFMEILLSAIEQDAWLLYAHGGLLGVLVGLVHVFLFGA